MTDDTRTRKMIRAARDVMKAMERAAKVPELTEAEIAFGRSDDCSPEIRLAVGDLADPATRYRWMVTDLNGVLASLEAAHRDENISGAEVDATIDDRP